jgi:tRNA pseudouridine-54 N-methylase
MGMGMKGMRKMETKIRVDKDDLEEFAKLFRRSAIVLREHGEDSDALELEQTAEFIEGYYLPYEDAAPVALRTDAAP